jgi:CrcB protein
MNFIWVFIGGGLGSISRYGISLGTQKFYTGNLPIATFTSNILACIILGITFYGFKDKLETTAWISPLLITGFCGGFSTFSSWSKETVDLIQQGQWIWAVSNILISLLFGIGILLWMKMSV